MQRTQKNYIIYLIMLFLFGGLIYIAVDQGSRIFSDTMDTITTVQDTPFKMFHRFLQENLHHPLTILLIQIIAVLLMVRLFGFLFSYIGQPSVIGEIVAGIVLGPSVLGLFFPDVFQFLFPVSSLAKLELLSQVGLILFMFVIGMELDFGILKNKINETLVISHAGILVPFFLGVLSSYWIYEEYASSLTPFLPFALFIGISMSITAFPVLARIIQERNMTKTPLGTLAIASAANDDVTAWCLLAIVIAIAKAGTFVSALYSVGLAIAYVAVMFLLVRPFLKKIGEVYANQEVINKPFVAFILLILVISSCVTEVIGIHALFGAFMAGVVMPSNIGFRKVMMEKVEDISLVFFLPLFFAFTGLRTQIGLINSPELWGVCALLITVAIAGKLGGCAIASRMVGESWKDSLTIGTLMNTRGLMELIALNIGYEMGVLPPSIFVILVIMALVTTFMTTPLLHWVERFFAHREALVSSRNKLVLCFGRSDAGRNLLTVYHLLFGQELKRKQVIAAHYTLGTDLSPLHAEQYAKESFTPLNNYASKLGFSVENYYRVTDKLVQEIVHLANEKQPDMVLFGARSHKHFDKISSSGFTIWLSQFRDKIGEVMEQVKSPVAIFQNNGFQEESKTSFVLGNSSDIFLIPYLKNMLKNGHSLFVFQSSTIPEDIQLEVNKLLEQYPQKLSLITYSTLEDIKIQDPHGLLIMSYTTYYTLIEDTTTPQIIPSLLLIRQNQDEVDNYLKN